VNKFTINFMYRSKYVTDIAVLLYARKSRRLAINETNELLY